jgi:hypothetical protein
MLGKWTECLLRPGDGFFLEFRKTEFRLVILEISTLKATHISVYITPLKFNNRRYARTVKKLLDNE